MSKIKCIIEDCPHCFVDDPNPECSKCHGFGLVYKPTKEIKKIARQLERSEK